MSPFQTLSILALAPLLVVGCQGEPEPTMPLDVQASSLSLEELRSSPAGDLAGKRFQTKSAVYRVNSYPGRERIDVYFDDPAPDECGIPLPRDNRRVFLRFPGLQEFETGRWTLEQDDPDPYFQIHYELGESARQDHGWLGRSGGVAVLAIDEVEERVVRGRVSLCFDDGHRSCIRGAFAADHCISRVDGQAVREGVGLHEPIPPDDLSPPQPLPEAPNVEEGAE